MNRTGQVFVRPESRTVAIYPIQDEFDRTGTGATTVAFVGGEAGRVRVSDPSLVVPTRLSIEEWRARVPGSVTVSDAGTDDMAAFDFSGEWTLACHPVGIGDAPDQPTAPVDLPAENTDGGVTVGSVSVYTTDNRTQQLSSPNGRWEGITCTDRLVLSDGEPAVRPDGETMEGKGIHATLAASNADPADDDYTIDVRLTREISGGSWETRQVELVDASGSDNSATLRRSAADAIWGGTGADVLDRSSYADPGSDFRRMLNDVRALADDPPVDVQVSRMRGRVDATLKCPP